MAENTYAELLLPGESRKRESREILTFRPRAMKAKIESNNSGESPTKDNEKFSNHQRVTIDDSQALSPALADETVASNVCDAVIDLKKKESEGVTVLDALSKISLHLTNNKKFHKAIRLMNQLVESSMDESNGDEFFSHLSNLMKNCPADRDITSSTYSQAYIDLITLYCAKKAFIANVAYLYQLQTFNALVCIRASLSTDDSFTYNKACSDLKALIIQTAVCDKSDSAQTQFEVDREIVSASNMKNRENAIFVCLDTAFRLYHWSWAKQPCDTVYACASERRLNFSDDSRESLDVLTMAITAAQRKDTTSWSGPQTIRTYNSTAHPLLSKNIGILR